MESPPAAASAVTRMPSPMRVLIATDTCRPQVNEIAVAIEQLIRNAGAWGATVELVSALDFPSLPLPVGRGLRLGLCTPRDVARRIASFEPTHIHIATEGPVGWATRSFCLRHGLPFSTSYHPLSFGVLGARVPALGIWAARLRRIFHSPAGAILVAIPPLRNELFRQGLQQARLWSLGVDTSLFHPQKRSEPKTKRPVFLYVGRVSAAANLPAFLSLKLPGSKVVVGEGPALRRLARQFPETHFLGPLNGERLAAAYASADVLVMPSRIRLSATVMLQALASGLPIAAYPVAAAKGILGDSGCGVLREDLQAAALEALTISSMRCRAYALRFRWAESARQFFEGVRAAKGHHEIDVSMLSE